MVNNEPAFSRFLSRGLTDKGHRVLPTAVVRLFRNDYLSIRILNAAGMYVAIYHKEHQPDSIPLENGECTGVELIRCHLPLVRI